MILWVRWPNQQRHSTEGRWLDNQSRANPTRLSSLKRKEKDVNKFLKSIYIASWRLKTQRHLKGTELNQARSKPDTVGRPVRTARTIVYYYNNTVAQRQFYLICPLHSWVKTNVLTRLIIFTHKNMQKQHQCCQQTTAIHSHEISN